MLENSLALQSEILYRYKRLKEIGAFSEVQYLNQRNIVAKTNGQLMQLEQTSTSNRHTGSTDSSVEVGTR